MGIDTYEEVIDYLYSLLPAYKNQGMRGRKINLESTKELCAYLGNPQSTLDCIHIAGTNGKGTTAHILSALYQSQGLRVGMYTSPHYKDYTERIKINSEQIDKQFIVAFVNEHRAFIEELRPSFFELTVGMMFCYFKDQKVDIAIVETGLGGRLDSTNVIYPRLSLITNVSYDHQDFLGETIREIATEKAGIIKKNISVVVGSLSEEALKPIKDIAEEKNAEVFYSSDYFSVSEVSSNMDSAVYSIKTKNETVMVNSDITGPFQQYNLSVALTAFLVDMVHQAAEIDMSAAYESLGSIRVASSYIGRWHWLSKNPRILVDGAHNIDAFEKLVLSVRKMEFDTLWFILGFSKDKDVSNMLELIPENAEVIFVQADIPRAMKEEVIVDQAKPFQFKYRFIKSPLEALEFVKKCSKTREDLIVATGSIYMIGELL